MAPPIRLIVVYVIIKFFEWCSFYFQVNSLQSMPAKKRMDLLRILEYIEDTLLQHWGEYGQFQELQERILRLRMILEDSTNNEDGLFSMFKRVLLLF